MQARQLMQGIATEVRRNADRQQTLVSQRQTVLDRAEQDVKSMSEFLEKSKGRKIRLQQERQDVQKAIVAQV